MNVDVDNASNDTANQGVPPDEDIQHWVETTVGSKIWSKQALENRLHVIKAETMASKECEISVRIVDEAEIADLNATYRNKQGPTNVLAFPAAVSDEIPLLPLGDIVISAPTIRREAREQGKTEQAHWAHMIVHGTLHLLGFDHQNNNEAQVMEAIETSILKKLQFCAPY
jgi:probable rRNA maturation factor